MATTAVKKSKARSDLVRQARMGRFALWTALVGTLLGGATFAVLMTATHTYLRQNDSSIDLSKSWDELGQKGVLVIGGLLVVSYLVATFVAGRMAWRRGWLHGLAAEVDLRDRIEAEQCAAEPVPVERGTTNGQHAGADVDVDGLTKDELYEIAQEHDISGRSQMSKEELARAVRKEMRATSRQG